MSSVKIELKREGLKRLGIVAGPVIVWVIWFVVLANNNPKNEPVFVVLFCALVAAVMTCASLFAIGLAVYWVYKGFVE